MSEEIPETKEIDGVLHYYSADLDEFVPEIKVHEATGVRYQLDAELMLYFEDEPYELTDEEKEIMALSDHADTYGTKYGKRWQKHIKEIYPAETGVLPARELWEVIPRKIDREAAEMKRILDQNYRLTYPKPDLNPIEKLWANVKRRLRFHMHKFDSFWDALANAFK